MTKLSLFALSGLSALLFASSAFAQEGVDYKTQGAGEDGSYSVEFLDNLLNADGIDANAAVIRGTWRPPRMLLIRPRANFVPELRKSVENL
ncbi:MAG: hypothetical protein JNL21_37700 [Myxococcales bacterium]|nr:hypothetical protein [Myxococcales bacterium]